MNGLKHLAAQTSAMASRQLRNCTYSQVKTLTVRRSTSWVTLEKPNPSIYKKIYEDASRVEKAVIPELAKAETMLKHASETVKATEANGGLQSHNTASLPADSRYLCTTLLKIPGYPATWPCDEEATTIKCDTTSTSVPKIKPMKP